MFNETHALADAWHGHNLFTESVDNPWITHLSEPQSLLARLHCTFSAEELISLCPTKSYPIRWSLPISNAVALARKGDEFKACFNAHRVHWSFGCETPVKRAAAPAPAKLASYGWKQHCRGLFETPIAA
ncbi:MAG: hypothetical protein IPI02_12350 [Sterolibacteriaceae bacterium]|nr:hypothetical protein [Sterolibacteriaceae bacterium]